MLKYTTPPLPLGNSTKVTILSYKDTTILPTSRIFTTPLALPAGLAHWAAVLGASIYPPHRLLASSAWLPSRQAAR